MIDPRPSPEPLWVGSTKEVRAALIRATLGWIYKGGKGSTYFN